MRVSDLKVARAVDQGTIRLGKQHMGVLERHINRELPPPPPVRPIEYWETGE